jgi:3-methyladenine DNA glycosylase AlkD
VHETRAAAVMVLAGRAELLLPSDLPLLTRWLREARTWALVDEIAPRVVGPLLARYPEVEATIGLWATDEDFWLRRAALLSYLGPLRRGEDVFERFAQLADGMLEEREFFVRKAIGWALRERGKRAPNEVHAWLLPRLARTSGVTLREAVKYLAPEQAAELKARRARSGVPGA